MVRLRPAQQEILAYRSGRMAISAVPGSGKTFVLTELATQLLLDGAVDTAADQQILIVTYLNSSVDNFRARISNRLLELKRPLLGYDVRTLHSLAREIVATAPAQAGLSQEFPVLDETRTSLFLARAVDNWIQDHQAAWLSFLPAEAADSPRLKARWRATTEKIAADLIRVAKNERFLPAAILQRLARSQARELAANTPAANPAPLLAMLADIYRRYQDILDSESGGLDFDDLVWRAADLLEKNPQVAAALSQRWPYVLEDEAQDSVPLQETILETLTGRSGNWVRVGDPNQAITSSFTSAHPRFFRAFLRRPDVVDQPLPESGRSSRKIIDLANHLVEWACHEHPVVEVRDAAFRLQYVRPTSPGDAQPNPPDDESQITIRVYRHREHEELPAVVDQAVAQAAAFPDQTLAILVPTNDAGRTAAGLLDDRKQPYDELLRDSGLTREIARALHAILGLLADPQTQRWLALSYAALLDMELLSGSDLEPQERERMATLLNSVYRPEELLFPAGNAAATDSLPAGVASPAEISRIDEFARLVRPFFDALQLPPDAMVLALADELFRHEGDLAQAYQISNFFRHHLDYNPTWRLPELVAQLDQVANGSARLQGANPADTGFEPHPGRITLTTQHRAKGLEWDTVYLLGIDSFWIPGHLDATFMGQQDYLGGDPGAEAAFHLIELMSGREDQLPGLSATETAHVEVIAERLRLLYVGITRARRNLHISRSRAVSVYQRDREAGAASALGALYQHLKQRGLL